MKIKNFLFALALVLAVAPSAFALQCKGGNYGSDECWTNVQVSTTETTPVIAGTVLVYDTTSGDADNSAYFVKAATASADYAKVAGVAQQTIATGDSSLVLVRGKGKVRAKSVATISSGDALYASTSRDAVNVLLPTGAKPIGFSLQAQTGSGNSATTIDAYITVV